MDYLYVLGTGKYCVFDRVSSNKHGVRDILEREHLELSVGRVQ